MGESGDVKKSQAALDCSCFIFMIILRLESLFLQRWNFQGLGAQRSSVGHANPPPHLSASQVVQWMQTLETRLSRSSGSVYNGTVHGNMTPCTFLSIYNHYWRVILHSSLFGFDYIFRSLGPARDSFTTLAWAGVDDEDTNSSSSGIARSPICSSRNCARSSPTISASS